MDERDLNFDTVRRRSHTKFRVIDTMGPTTKQTTTKNNSGNNHDSDTRQKFLEKALLEGRVEAKREFELQRTNIFDTLSDSYKRMFGQIVFAKWKTKFLPALILSPYHVPPGVVRTMWMDKYEKVRCLVVGVRYCNIYLISTLYTSVVMFLTLYRNYCRHYS
jgi:hypothetical protein